MSSQESLQAVTFQQQALEDAGVCTAASTLESSLDSTLDSTQGSTLDSTRMEWEPAQAPALAQFQATTPAEFQASAPARCPAPAAKTCTLRNAARKPLPDSLKLLGNESAWRAVHAHLTDKDKRGTALVLHGPVGCGKSFGVQLLVEALGWQLATLDGADASTTSELVDWAKKARSGRSKIAANLPERTVLFLDDFESFTPDSRLTLRKTVLDMGTDSKKNVVPLTPLLITCGQVKAPDMAKHLSHLPHVRLYAPNARILRSWFAQHHVWTNPDTGKSIRGVPARFLDKCSELMQAGDIRKVALALQFSLDVPLPPNATNREDKSERKPEEPCTLFSSGFEAARCLLQKRVKPADWASSAQQWDLPLLQHHVTYHVGGAEPPSSKTPGRYLTGQALDRLVAGLEDFSVLDVRSVHVEHSMTQWPMTAAAVAHVVRLTTRTRDVGALAPPRLPANGKWLGETELDTWKLPRGPGKASGGPARPIGTTP